MNRLLFAVLATSGIGLLGSNTMPLFVGALIDGLGLDEAGIGLQGSLELAGVGLGALSVAPLTARRSKRALALLGVGIAAAGYAGAAASATATTLALLRIAAGVGCGIAMAAGHAAASAADEPDRLFARVAFLGGLFAAILLGTLPFGLSAGGFRAGYVVLVGICLLCVPLVRLLPAAPATGPSGDNGPTPLRDWRLGLAILAANGLFSVADQALWTFTERIGVGVGLTGEGVGGVLAAGTLIGLAGAIAAMALGTRAGRTLPLVVGLGGIGAVRVALPFASSPSEYAALQILWAIAFLFVVPYLLGTAAALDRAGRWTAAAGALSMVGTAIGPAPAGYLISQYGPQTLAVFLGVISVASFAILLPVALELDRRTRSSVLTL